MGIGCRKAQCIKAPAAAAAVCCTPPPPPHPHTHAQAFSDYTGNKAAGVTDLHVSVEGQGDKSKGDGAHPPDPLVHGTWGINGKAALKVC